MDFTSIIGMLVAFGLMIYGMVNGHDFSVITVSGVSSTVSISSALIIIFFPFNLVTSIISLHSLEYYTFSDITIRLIIAQFDFYVYKIRQAFSTFSHH